MKNTYYIGGNLVFPLSYRGHANRGRLPNQTYSIQTRIATLLEEFNSIVSAFEDNEYLQFFISSVEANANNMPPPRQYDNIKEDWWDEEDVSVDDSFYNGDPVVPSGCSPVCSQGRSPPPQGGVRTTPPRRNHVAMVGFAPTIDSVQLYETAETNVNILGATVMIGDSKRVLDTRTGYSNYMRIIIPLNFSADYEKVQLKLVADYSSYLHLTYPAISSAMPRDFKHIEAQLEVEVQDSNDGNRGFITNLVDRIVGIESLLASMEKDIKSKILILPTDPATGRAYTCNNYHWQGTTHNDSGIDELYLRPYKNTKIRFPSIPKRFKRVVVSMLVKHYLLIVVIVVTKVGLFLFLARAVINLQKSLPRKWK